ncbi:MAG: hypothetical protein MJA83_04570 [Gammaproteobacteria bacterium]|nr:hypothetical protein [Gammaproteobacteria bacterium]
MKKLSPEERADLQADYWVSVSIDLRWLMMGLGDTSPDERDRACWWFAHRQKLFPEWKPELEGFIVHSNPSPPRRRRYFDVPA